MTTPESSLKSKVIQTLIYAGYIVIRFNSGGAVSVPCNLLYLPPEYIASRSGLFDLLVLSPAGKFTWLDTKATRKPSPAQLDFAAAMEARGVDCLFIRDVDELMAELER
jgi:hypothetical protein